MSFIGSKEQGVVYAPGYFLANCEDCTRLTFEMSQEGAATSANGGKYVPMGTIYPAAGANAIGIVYEDVDVSTGNMPGSVVTAGIVYENRLPATVTSATKTALKNITFLTEGEVTRPSFEAEEEEQQGNEEQQGGEG